MAARLRPARPEECAALTDLCLRAKAHWGYDADFLELCRPALTVAPADLDPGRLVVAEAAGRLLGLAEILPPAATEGVAAGGAAELAKLFVAPEAMGRGIGRALMDWARAAARAAGARRLEWLADPAAVGFYLRLGGRVIGAARSDAVPGRRLPRMTLAL